VRIVLHAGAVADLTAAGDWYEAQLPGLGLDLADEVQHALDVISESPNTWPLWPGVSENRGVRRFSSPGSRSRWRTSSTPTASSSWLWPTCDADLGTGAVAPATDAS